MGEITDHDRKYLLRCVQLARRALDCGDEPFGAILVDGDGHQRIADRNRVAGGDGTRHAELAIARWSAEHLTPETRARSTVYTSGEPCPMCAAAHAWVGLGRIVYASSTEQLISWYRAWGIPAGPVAPLPISAVAPGVPTAGPDPEISAEVKELHRRRHGIS